MVSLDNLSGSTFYSYLNRLVFSVRTCGYSKTCWVCIKKDSSNSFVTQHYNVFQIKRRISIIPLSQKVCWFERVFTTPPQGNSSLASYFLSLLAPGSALCSMIFFESGRGYLLEPNNVYLHYVTIRLQDYMY